MTSESAERWKINHSQSCKETAARRKSGNLTPREILGYSKLKEFWNSPSERNRRSLRSSGKNNSQYKGPYIIDNQSFEFIKCVKKNFKVYGSIANIRKMLLAKGHEINF